MFSLKTILFLISLVTFVFSPALAEIGGQAGVRNFTGGIGMTGNRTDGSDQISSVNLNGSVNPLTWGVVCDGSTDNSTPLQNAINAACDGTHTGEVDIPAACYGASGHFLAYSTGISIPNNCVLKGLGGAAQAAGGTRAVQLNYTGSGVAITTPTSAASNGVRLENFRLHNTGTGTTGILLSGAFNAVVDGVLVDGAFSGAGIDVASNSASSVNNVLIQNTQSYQNAYGLLLDASLNNTKNVGGVTLLNDAFVTSTINNVYLHGYDSSNLNVVNILFAGSNIAEGNITNIQCTNGADIGFSNTFIENVNTPFSLTNCVDVWAEDTNISRTGLTTTPIVADGYSTYNIDQTTRIGGGSGHRNNQVERMAYVEGTAWQSATGDVGLGQLTNLMKDSEDQSTANWTTGGTITSRTADAAAAPNGATTATQVVKGSGGTIRQTSGSVGTLDGRCFVASVWAQTSSGVDNSYTIKLADTGAANNFSTAVYQITTKWKRLVAEGCAPSVDANTSVVFYPLFATESTPETVNLWGAQVSEVPSSDYPTNMIPYVKTASNAFTSTTKGIALEGQALLQAGTPSITGGGSLATGSTTAGGTVLTAAATNNKVTTGATCLNAVVGVLSDETTAGGAKVTASDTTSFTFSATANDNVDYWSFCR